MLFEKITPEEAGVSSARVAQFIEHLERRGCTMHSVLLMKDDKLFGEYYWAPFDKDFCHRMYSQTKSYVSIAIGLLLEEGKLTLDDPIVAHFPEKLEREAPLYLAKQTIRDMLRMCTCGGQPNWFLDPEPDRTRLYLNKNSADHPSGTNWMYDSAGSQVLCALVEKLSGMRMLDYLRGKLFDKMGTFQTATILKTKNGDSWGDSALVCTPRDMASCARLVMHYGDWDGQQLMSRDYLMEATSNLADNSADGFDSVFANGYGYQIWRTEENGFAFVGMGNQLTIMLPDKDLIFVCTADDQGYEAARQYIVSGFFDYIARDAAPDALPKDPVGEKRLAEAAADLRLRALSGGKDSPVRESIDGMEYACPKNPTGITRFRFDFAENGGTFSYTNAQGDKQFPFGMCENAFAKFPQLGYSNENGGLRTTDGFMYDAAFSAAWRAPGDRLMIRVQIIDRYFANATFTFTFKGDECRVTMVKTAEDFLGEYQGAFTAKKA